MLFSKVTVEAVEACIAAVNPRYEGNVMGEWQRTGIRPTMLNHTHTRWRGRIMVRDSRAVGARRSWQGRRMPAACWHVTRDVLGEVLRVAPEAKITTQMATYTAATWEERYPATAYVNVGSALQPRYMPDLCACGPTITLVPFASLGGAAPLARSMYTPLAARIPGRCVTCKMSTYSPLMAWCSKQCHDAYMSAPDKETLMTVS
jgi:hypothetical protein